MSTTNVCPRCSNGRPICTDKQPDGSRYSHEETCATYEWADDVCAGCASDVAAGGDAGLSTVGALLLGLIVIPLLLLAFVMGGQDVICSHGGQQAYCEQVAK